MLFVVVCCCLLLFVVVVCCLNCEMCCGILQYCARNSSFDVVCKTWEVDRALTNLVCLGYRLDIDCHASICRSTVRASDR